LLLILSVCAALFLAVCQEQQSGDLFRDHPNLLGLAVRRGADALETFVAPNGKTVSVLVKGPIGSGTYSRAIKPGETPDAYFPPWSRRRCGQGASSGDSQGRLQVSRAGAMHGSPNSAACNLPSQCNANLYYNCAPHWTIGQYPQGQVTEPNSITDLDIDFSGSELDFARL
jgi:hypothetical protein